MSLHPRLALVLLLGLSLTGCNGDTLTAAEERRLRMLSEEAGEMLHRDFFWKLLHEQLYRFEYVERGALTAEMTPEEALDAVETGVDGRCDIFTRTSATTARLEARRAPRPYGCMAAFVAVPYALSLGRNAEGALTLELRTEAFSLDGATQAVHTFSALAPARSVVIHNEQGWFEGTAREVDGSFGEVLDGRGAVRMPSGHMAGFRAEALEKRGGGVCIPFSGRFIAEFPEGFPEAGIEHAVEVGLTFEADGKFEAQSEDGVIAGVLRDRYCGCQRACSGPID